MGKVKVNKYFRQAYFQQITIKDFVTYSNTELTQRCISSFKELNRLKQKTIAALVKEFLSDGIEKQRHILTLFLLTERDTDTQYLAYLMYDMISNETY